VLGASLTEVAALEKSFRAVLSSAWTSIPTVSSHFSSRTSLPFFDDFEAPEEALFSFFCCFAASFSCFRNAVPSWVGGGWVSVWRDCAV